MNANGKYLYCVIQTDEPQEFGPLGMGDRGDPLVTVHWRDLACVISDSPLDDYPVSREHTMAHHKAIEQVYKRFPALLPVCFNTIAKREQEIVERVLKARRQELLGRLGWVADKCEVGVKVYWRAMEPVFEEILELHPEIQTFKEELAKLPPAARYYDQIELGKQVEAALKLKREQEGRRIVDALKVHAVDVKLDPVYGDRWILNAAFLIEKMKGPALVKALQELAEASGGNLTFKYVDEGAPFHFVELRITWEEGKEEKEEKAHVSHR